MHPLRSGFKKCAERLFKATCFLFLSLLASQASGLEVRLDNDDDIRELRQLYESGNFSARVSVALDTGDQLNLELVYVEPFADDQRVFLDGKQLESSEYETGRRYYRGSVVGDPRSYAFLSVEPSGDSSLYVDYAGNQYKADVSQRGMELIASRTGPTTDGVGEWLVNDDIQVPELDPPSSPTKAQVTLPSGGATSPRTESVAVAAGWYGPWELTVPAGNYYAGAINRGPGIANVYIVPDGTNPMDVNYCEYSRCFIENPDAGVYDVWVYKFDSKMDTPDLPTSVDFGFGTSSPKGQRGSAALAGNELYRAKLAFELDDGLFSQMNSSPSAVNNYLAELVSYVSATYEEEIATRLLVGDVVLYSNSADPYSATTTFDRLEEVRDYWRANYGSIDRALAVHLGVSPLSGGIAYVDVLCDYSYGYSVSRVDGSAPTDASQMNWDAIVVAHEVGHNFVSPHTHCYAGLEGNNNPVDACYNGQADREGCWAGNTSLPGIGSLTGGSANAQNGTIMSYCHLLGGGYRNIARTFGATSNYGIEADRVPTHMARATAQAAAASPQCLPVITVGTNGVPSAPTGVSASAGNGQATVSWTAPSSDGGSAITGYIATAAPGGETCTTTGATSCTVTSLTNGTSYTFTVIATNSNGNGPSSSASNAVTPVSIEELVSGVAASGLSGAQGSSQYFFIDVPSGAESLTVSLDVGTGDPDIYVDTSFPPTENAMCGSYNEAGFDELCELSDPAPGRYYILVYGYTSYSDSSLTGTTTSAPPGKPTIASITPGDRSLEVAFSDGAGGLPDSYTVTCADQSSSSRWTLSSNLALAQSKAHFVDDEPVTMGGVTYPNAQTFHESLAFRESEHRCATKEHNLFLRSQAGFEESALFSDCSLSETVIDPAYDPVIGRTVVIPLYFHVIYKSDGTGYVEPSRIDAQIAVLNDDFGGTSFGGDSGFDTKIQFELVDVNYVQNDEWYTDAGPAATSEFKSSLAQSPQEYINIYTNDAGGGGTLGYATLPPGAAGTTDDGVVMLHSTIGGRNNGFSVFDQGRTLVHEVGHYLGLLHTFQDGVCSNTYTTQDLIVDTPEQSAPDFGTSASSACGVTSAIENFMNYSDDSAMYTFTEEQTNRMICSQTNYRPDGYSINTTPTFTASGTSSPLSVTGLTNGNTYSCSVVATNSGGSSPSSDAVIAVPAAIPAAPTIERTDYGDGEIYLYVTVSDDGGSDVTGYTATCSDGTTTFTGTSTDSPITVSGLTNGTAYTCTVTATNAIGTSSASSSTASITPEEGATGLPIWLLYQATQ